MDELHRLLLPRSRVVLERAAPSLQRGAWSREPCRRAIADNVGSDLDAINLSD